MNILMITKWYPYEKDPQMGVFIQKHARAIALSNKIHVIYAYSAERQKEKFLHRESENGNLTEHRISYQKDTSPLSKIINAQRYKQAVEMVVDTLTHRGFKADILHAYILLRTGWMARQLSRKLNIPYIISEQWSGYATGKYAAQSSVVKRLTKSVLKDAAGLTVVSEFLRDKMVSQGLSHPRTIITPNIVEPRNSDHPTQNKSKKIAVLMVADQVDEIKNISGVIRAVEEIAKHRNDFELRIIGHGKDQLRLMRMTEEKGLLNSVIHFEGLKDNNEVYAYLHRSDFLVMNSRFETFSLICCEAMSCGKPVLATRCGGPESFVNSDTGILIPVDHHEDLVSGLEKMLDSFQDFHAEKIRESVEKRFSIETLSLTFSNFYEKVTKP